ncbi:hypothetical protein C0J52_10229 [Blattella germanica]|nr:hypothetical protein C0J52_10229 [Blattella germanica]
MTYSTSNGNNSAISSSHHLQVLQNLLKRRDASCVCIRNAECKNKYVTSAKKYVLNILCAQECASSVKNKCGNGSS